MSEQLQNPKRIHRKNGLSRKEERYRLTRSAAERLAGKIANYWQHRGVSVRTWVEAFQEDEAAAREFIVRSQIALTCRPPGGAA